MMNRKDATITIRLSERDKELFKQAAAQRDIPMSQLLREAVREYLKEK